MIICSEVDRRPPAILPLSEDEQIKMIAERLIEENRWVEEFLTRLEGFVRETKH